MPGERSSWVSAPDRVGHIVLADRSGVGTLDYRAAGYKEIV